MQGLPGAAMRPLWIIISLLLITGPAVTSGAAPAVASAAAAEHRAKGPARQPVARQRTGRPALTEDEALRLGLADAAFGQVQDAQVDVARSALVEAGLPPNPELGLSYESADGAGDPSETTLRLSQTFDTSGRRGLRQKGAEAQLEAARWTTESEHVERGTRVRSEFYRVLHEQERLAVLTSWDARVGASAQIVRDRTGAGEASGYDLRRLEHERSLARAERDEVAGGLAQAWQSLLALLGANDRRYGAVDGRLLPPSPPPLDTLGRRSTDAESRGCISGYRCRS